jgi:hypothetical protein
MTKKQISPPYDYVSGLLPFLGMPDIRKYWQSVGQFVSTFSSLEVTMQLALWSFSGLSNRMARALLSGSTRVDAAMNLINKIAATQKWKKSKRAELNAIFSQLGHINKLRNDLLHYGATSAKNKDEWIISNRAVEDTKKRIRTTKITTEALSRLSRDVLNIQLRLSLLTWGHLMQPKTRQIFGRVRQEPWQYKFRQRVARRRKRRKIPPAQLRPPQLSQR